VPRRLAGPAADVEDPPPGERQQLGAAQHGEGGALARLTEEELRRRRGRVALLGDLGGPARVLGDDPVGLRHGADSNGASGGGGRR
jgi:hypothetical protein